jgi:hypothetical protein
MFCAAGDDKSETPTAPDVEKLCGMLSCHDRRSVFTAFFHHSCFDN